MIFPSRATLLPLLALGACSSSMHSLEAHLDLLRPESITSVAGLDYPAGTLLCPLTPYQTSVAAAAPEAQRINAFMGRQQYLGEEGTWSLVIIQPGTTGDDRIEHLLLRRSTFDVINSRESLGKLVEKVPADFEVLDCVPVEHASVLTTPSRASQRKVISFGRWHGPMRQAGQG